MPTPRKGYWLDGKRLPSVTTVLGKRKDPGGLLFWANKAGLEGKTLDEARQGAPEAGTLAHDAIEAYIHGIDFFRDSEIPRLVEENTTPEVEGEKIVRMARDGFENFLEWWVQTGITVTETEMQLVSKEHRFGGTPDALGKFRDDYVLLDWKVSKGLYGDYLLQLAAYMTLIEENYPDVKIKAAHLCRFAKGVPVFTHVKLGRDVLDTCWEGFWHLRQVYDIDQWIKNNRIV